ncbi:PTS glucose transporter subunit IIA [Aliidiomarina sp. Khilg15.8]
MHLLSELPAEPRLAQIMAPATGRVSPLDNEPYAIHQLGLLGQGVIYTPNTSRLCAPTRCKIVQVSPDRRIWLLAMPGHLRLRLEVTTQTTCPLPLVNASAKAGDVCDAGTPLCVLTTQCMQHQPQLILTLTAKNAAIALLPHYGRAMVAQDAILSIYPWVEPSAQEQEEETS